MTSPFQPKQVQVPGILSDDALQEQLKQYAAEKNAQHNASPPPNSAVEFSDKIARDYIMQPPKTLSGIGPPTAPQRSERLQKQDTAIDVRSDILSGVTEVTPALRNLILGPIVGLFGPGGPAEKQFGYGDEEAQAISEERLQEAERQKQAIDAHADVRAKLRGMSDDQAASMGLPIAPGRTKDDDMLVLEEQDERIRQMAQQNVESKEAATKDKALQPEIPWWLSAIRSGIKGAADVGLDAARAGPIVWEGAVGLITGNPERSTARAWVDTVDATISKLMPEDKAFAQDFVTQLARGGGSMAAFMLGGYVARSAGLPASANTTILGAASGASSQFREAEAHDASALMKYLSFIAGGAIGLSEAWPIDRMFMRADQATGGLVKRMLSQTAATSAQEFIQEFGQAVGTDIVAKYFYDAERDLSLVNWLKAGAVGAITGGLAGVATTVLHEAGVTPNPPTGNEIDDAQREAAATLVIDTLQDRFDKMTAQPPADVAMSAEEAANAIFEGYVRVPQEGEDLSADVTPTLPEGVVEGPGGTIPVNENGKLELRHYSQQPLDEIDPAQRGTGPLRGKERERLGERVKDDDVEFVDVEDDRYMDLYDRKYTDNGRPERAVRIDGKVYTGEDHYNALENAKAAVWEARGEPKGDEANKEIDDYVEDNAELGLAVKPAGDPRVVDRSYYGAGTPPTAEDKNALAKALREASKQPHREGELGAFTYPRSEAERAAFRKHVEQRGYAPEGGLGDYKHIVEADPATIYNALEDPLGLRAQLDAELKPNERVTQFERLVKDAGFKGLYYAESELGQTVLMFEKAKPVRVESERFGLPLGEIATKADLNKLKGEFFKDKGGWAILTGTQERLGDAKSDMNVKQNEKLRKELTRRGIEFEEVGGTYQGVDQGPSFLVFMPEREALDLASRYKQESILTRKGLEYGDGRLVPALPDKTVVGPEAKELDFYSTLPGGEAFSVGLDFGGTVDPDILAKTGDPLDPAKQQALMDQVPGLKNILPNMTPAEQARVRKANAQKLVDMVESLPSAEEMAVVAFSGRAKRGWYQRSAEALVQIFGLEDAPRFSALLAALSPQTSVETNTINALNVWTAWIRMGRPSDAKGAAKALYAGLGGKASTLGAWEKNSIAALTTADVNAIELSGPKVSSFMNNLNNVTHEVTNDAWMTNYAGVTDSFVKGQWVPKDGKNIKSLGYMAMSTVVRRAAKIASDLTGETWTPSEVQETVWSWAKTVYEKSTATGMSAQQLLDAGNLTAEDISSTPDFATLFVTGVYRNILERGGYDLGGVNASDQRNDGRDAGGRDPFSSKGLGVAQPDFTAHIQRAARRLDALRSARQGQEWIAGVAEEEEVSQLPDNVSDQDVDDFLAQVAPPVESDAFKKWFGDSKVVDENGKPLVVYHGTDYPDFVAFNSKGKGIAGWFAEDPATANEYTERGSDQYDGAPRIVPTYLAARNPAVISLDTDDIVQASEVLAPLGVTVAFKGDYSVYEIVSDPRVVAALKGKGFDSIKARERGRWTWAAFDPTQIKSVNNRGTFDQNNPDILASTSAARGPYKAEQTRPSQGIPSTPGQTGTENADISLSKITRNLATIMDLTVRQGRISIKSKPGAQVMGQYQRSQDVARVRTMNDLSTITHEAGHKLFYSAGPPLQKFVMDNEAELMKIATDLYGGDTNVMPKAQHIAEGFAEFFRIYTLNRAYALNKYANATSSFETMLDANDKKLKDGLNTIGQQFAAWLQMPSAQMVSNMIVSGKQDTGVNAAIKELREVGAKTWFHEVARKFVEESVNRYAGLDDLINQTLNVGQANKGKAVDLKRADDPRALIRLAANSGARGQVQITDGVMGYRSVTTETRGLREALLRYHGQPADGTLGRIDPVRQKDFAAYIVALRGIDEYRRFSEGKIERPPVAATLGDLKLVVDEMNSKYGTDFNEAAAIAHEYGMGLWKKAFDAGLMTKDTYVDGLDRQFYVPLQRDMSDKRASFGQGPLTGGSKLVKQFRGSDRDIVDPMDILMHKTFALEQIIARNDVMKTMAQLADKAGKAGAMIERIPAQQLIGTQFSVKEIARQLTKDENMTEADAVDLMTLLEASIKDEKTLALFRQQQAATLGENVLFFWENGRLAALQLIEGDVGADIVNVVNGVGRENLPLFADTIAATSSAFRSAITLWPDFLIVNFIRDQMSAFILTNVGYKPFWTGIKGVGDELRQKGWAKQYNAAMGIMGGMNVASLHNARVNRDINVLRRKGYLTRAVTAESGMLGKIKGFGKVMELTETGSRLGIFKAAVERAKADGLNDWEAAIEGSYTATDYMNFGLNGSRMLLARRTIPFLNAQLQGLYKMMRTLGADEVRQRKGLRFALSAYFKSTKNMDLSRTEKLAIQTGRKAWIKMASLGFISAALHFLFEDDPDYQEAGEYLRTTGWVIPMGNGRMFYIPKPFELAMLANFTERAFEYASGDDTAKARFLRGLAMTMSPPTAPPVIQSAVEYVANRDFFTGQEIIPSYMQALSPELQFNNYTTSFAKQVGEIMGWSPMVVDHFMSSLGASAYRDLTGLYGAMDPARPEMDATDAPLLRRFVRDVRRGSTSSRDFWATASTLDGSLRRAEVSYKRYIESGNDAGAEAFLSTLDEDDRAVALLNTHFEAEAKRLNPFYRTRQINTVVSAMRRELVTDLGVDDTAIKGSGETIKLSRREKNELDTALSEYARREMRNTLIAMGAPGWTGKRRLKVDKSLDLIGAIDPRIREELDRRIEKAKVYSGEIVEEYWPEVKDRLLRDRENTFLDDVLAVAKVAR